MINRCRPTAEGDSRRELANALARGGSRSVQGRRASDTRHAQAVASESLIVAGRPVAVERLLVVRHVIICG